MTKAACQDKGPPPALTMLVNGDKFCLLQLSHLFYLTGLR